MLGKLDSYMWKNEIRTLPTAYTKINSKLIKDVTLKPETINIKLLEENIGRKLDDINQSRKQQNSVKQLFFNRK